MTRNYQVLEEAQATLAKFPTEKSGFLIGVEDGSNIVVLNAISSSQDQREMFKEFLTLIKELIS